MKKLFKIIFSVLALSLFVVGCEEPNIEESNDNNTNVEKPDTEEPEPEEKPEPDDDKPAIVDPNKEKEQTNRAALIEFYNATNGDSWTRNQNWCTDAPLAEWYGVSTEGSSDIVTELSLSYNNLSGAIPNAICRLADINTLDLYGSDLSGAIPDSICVMKSLTSLILDSDEFTGAIPESIGQLTELTKLRISGTGLSGAIPESIGELTKLTFLEISSNNIHGTIPYSLGKLTKLKSLDISGMSYVKGVKGMGQISGEIPDIFHEMSELESLTVHHCQVSGQIPSSFNELHNLKTLKLDYNQLEGSIDFLVNLPKLTTISLEYNNFSGAITDELGDHPLWNKSAWTILTQHTGYGFSSYPDIFLEPSALTTINKEEINSAEIFAKNKLTCVLLWSTKVGVSTYYLESIKELYDSYAPSGFELLTLNKDSDLSAIANYVDDNDIPGKTCQITGYYYNYGDGTNTIKYMPLSTSPTYLFVDESGRVVFSESVRLYNSPNLTQEEASREFLADYFGYTADEGYESTDYSKDGEVVTLQKATVGRGINIVIVGDGFTDQAMASGGEYETRMSEAMDHLFSEEPFTTYRDRFNVYTVKAVSKNAGVNGKNQTAFGCKFGEGTAITGDDKKVFRYALKVPSITSTDFLSVITVLNSSKYAGMCYMYSGNDASVAYCPIVSRNDELFRQIVTHEAGGHGFAKLLDEYAYAGAIPLTEINTFLSYKSFGWGANVDVTPERDAIQWAHLLADPRYEGHVGVYEGALTYLYDVYRPSEKSIMRYNIGGYNAPSRESIYRRIMELSGEGYSYENFVEYDKRNIEKETSTDTRQGVSALTPFVPLAHPVVVAGRPE